MEKTAKAEKKETETGACQTSGAIYQALAKVTAQIGAVGKNKEMAGPNARYKFRGIDDIYNAVNRAFGENGIFCLPIVLSRETQQARTAQNKPVTIVILRVRYVFCAADGSSVSCEVVGEAQDSSDKGTNKAMSIAHKYAIMQMFCISTEDMAEPDSERVEYEPCDAQRPETARRDKEDGARREPAPRQESGQDRQKAELSNIARSFIDFMNQRHNRNQQAIKAELSDFFGRRIFTVSDLEEDEIRCFLNACEERDA